MIFIARIGIYVLLLYQTYFTSVWVALALGFIFVLLEFLVLLLRLHRTQINALIYAQNQTTTTDFGFASQAITEDEAELIDQIREGDLDAASKFLNGRCQNKMLDFSALPDMVAVTLAQRLVNAINRGESPTWKELLAKQDEPEQSKG